MTAYDVGVIFHLEQRLYIYKNNILRKEIIMFKKVSPTEKELKLVEKEEPKAEAPAKPLEVDISELFDIKLTNPASEPKKGKKPKKDPMPGATKAVADGLSKEEDIKNFDQSYHPKYIVSKLS